VFKGWWKAEDLCLGKLMEEWPMCTALHRIGAQLQAIALKHPQGSCAITNVHYGPGLPACHVEEAETGVYDDAGDMGWMDDTEAGALKHAVHDACHWCWQHLQECYESDTGDEAAVDGIEANEYEFDRDGDVIPQRPARTTGRDNQVSEGA
jgi:hypothetical protein